MRRLFVALALASVAIFASALPASAAARYTLFGDATKVHPGFASHTAIQLRSVGSTFGGIDFRVPSGLRFGDIQNLGTNYQFTAGSCGGGAPRFQINVDGKNAFVYIGPPPNYTGCPQNVWQDTGNLATPVSFVDTSQLPGGTFYDTFATADLKYGSDGVTGIQLVTDAGWLFGTQTVLADNVRINDATYTFEGRGHGHEGDDSNDG
ncbi:MAG TPA: hypothetical protein VFL27_11220 [Candidatus Dormibacteraeota bacterium]|nr:hypothetical protein [Candidatus Dormibacteraeota bacterium]